MSERADGPWLDMNAYPNLAPDDAVPEQVLGVLRDALRAPEVAPLHPDVWQHVLHGALAPADDEAGAEADHAHDERSHDADAHDPGAHDPGAHDPAAHGHADDGGGWILGDGEHTWSGPDAGPHGDGGSDGGFHDGGGHG